MLALPGTTKQSIKIKSEKEEEHNSFTPCQKDSSLSVPEKPEVFLCRTGTVAAEVILNEEALTFNQLN